MSVRSSSDLVTVENPEPDRGYTVEFEFPEFTALYAVTGEPIFATVTIRYVPDARCLETVSLKEYLNSYRDEALFYEAAVNRVLNDLVSACGPVEMAVVGRFNVRGGIETTVTAGYRRG